MPVSVGEGRLLFYPFLAEVVTHEFFKQVLGVQSSPALLLHPHLLVQVSNFLLHQLSVFADVQPLSPLLALLDPAVAVVFSLLAG